jgi:hypothetical protein
VADEETLHSAADGSSERARPDSQDIDPGSGNGDDREHWLKVEDLLRQRRSNLLDFGLPARLVARDRPGR